MIAICTGGVLVGEKEMPRQTPPLRTRRGKEKESESELVSRTGDDARAARSNATARLTKTKKSQKRRQRLRRRRQLRRQRSNVAAASVTARCHNRWRCGGGSRNRSQLFFYSRVSAKSSSAYCMWTSVKRVSRARSLLRLTTVN